MFSHSLDSFSKVIASVVIASTLVFALPLSAIAEGEDVPPPPPQEEVVVETVETPPQEVPQEVVTETVEAPVPEEGAEEVPAEEVPPQGLPGEGENGGEAGTPEENTPAVVETGDAISEGEIVTDGNTNDTGVSGGDTTVVNDNEATTTTNALIEAETGENVAQGGGGSALIDTGNALASGNVINVINTNIFNSNGLLLFLSGLFGEGFDLRNFNFGWDGNSSGCSLTNCAGGGADLNIQNTNSVNITNTVIVRSATGGNTASSTGDGSIETGDAYASANLVNFANTNVVNSNYLLLALNNFGTLNGDIVLPNKDFFAEYFNRQSNGCCSGDVDVNNTNNATVNNNVDVEANTGGNSAESNGGGSVVATGDASAAATVVNQVNTNLFDTDSVFILLRIHGNWAGDIFGLPDGISWVQTPFGIQLMSDPGEDSSGGDLTKLTASGGSLGINNTNNATINNNVGVYALTGDNKVSAGEGEALIESGNAYASANVVNIANTNIVGKNWIFAIFNIFGDWNGNLSFGQPDLWIGTRVETPEAIVRPGSNLKFFFTVTNFGDAEATDVRIKNRFTQPLIGFYADGTGEEMKTFSIGNIKPGETKEIEYTAKVTQKMARGIYPVTGITNVVARESENNMANNEEEVDLLLTHADNGVVGGENLTLTPDPKLTVTKTFSGPKEILPGTNVDYTIKVKNEGGEAYHSTLFDVIKNKRGRVISEEQWNLGVIYPNEEITVTYTAEFGTSTPVGVYTNEAFVESIGRHPSTNPFYGVFADSNVASTSVTVYRPLAYEFSIPGLLEGEDGEGGIEAEDALAVASVERIVKEVKHAFPLPDISNLLPPTGGVPDSTITPPGSYGREIQAAGGGFLPRPTKIDLFFLFFLLTLVVANQLVSNRGSFKEQLADWKNRFASF